MTTINNLSILETHQAVLFPYGSHPLSLETIESIELLVDSKDISDRYEHVVKGDTEESHEVEVLRLIKDKHQYVNAPDAICEMAKRIEAEMFCEQMRSFLQFFSPLTQQINRMQVNVLQENGFVGQHRDNDDTNHYTLVAILNLSRFYEGGHYCIGPLNRESICFDAKFGDLLISNATVNHHVTRVTKGVRKTLVCFLGTAENCS